MYRIPFLLVIILSLGCLHPLDPGSSCQYDVYDHGDTIIRYGNIHFVAWGLWPERDANGNQIQMPYQYYYTWESLANNKSQVFDRLAEYGVAGASVDAVQLYQLNSLSQDSPVNDTDSNQFVAKLNEAFQNGDLPYPDGSSIYVLFLPPGMTTTFAKEESFAGYHKYSSFNGIPYTYNVIRYFDDFDFTNSVVSHELYETLTDPYLETWYTDQIHEGEIADLCDGQYVVIDGLQVQKVWSRDTCQCL